MSHQMEQWIDCQSQQDISWLRSDVSLLKLKVVNTIQLTEEWIIKHTHHIEHFHSYIHSFAFTHSSSCILIHSLHSCPSFSFYSLQCSFHSLFVHSSVIQPSGHKMNHSFHRAKWTRFIQLFNQFQPFWQCQNAKSPRVIFCSRMVTSENYFDWKLDKKTNQNLDFSRPFYLLQFYAQFGRVSPNSEWLSTQNFDWQFMSNQNCGENYFCPNHSYFCFLSDFANNFVEIFASLALGFVLVSYHSDFYASSCSPTQKIAMLGCDNTSQQFYVHVHLVR